MKIFATKTPPDNTINRIVDLENQMADVLNRFKNLPAPTEVAAAPVGNVELSFDANDLIQRVRALEDRADKSDRRLDKDEEILADHERRIKALEGMDLSAAMPVSASGEIDTASIMKQITLIKTEQNSMRTDFNSYKQTVVQDL